jgi:hypothetical protein
MGKTSMNGAAVTKRDIRRTGIPASKKGVPNPVYAMPPELLEAMREIVRIAIMTLAALRDPDRRYQGLASMPQNVVHDVREAYGYSSATVREFIPSAFHISQMEVVLPWLAWVRREEGEMAIRRIIGWAMGGTLWRLGMREKCSDRTIMNRIDRSICAMIGEFASVNVAVERIEEPYKGATYAMVFERPEGRDAPVLIQKVYVGGLGMMRNGKRLRTAIETV